MDERLSKKDIIQMFDFIIDGPYAGLDRCLKNAERVDRAGGVEGWGVGFFKDNNTICITSGYDAIRAACVVSRELVQEYEEEEILNCLSDGFVKKRRFNNEKND